MAIAPDFAGFRATSGWSRRSFDFRAASSGPWHLKQFRESNGRTSRVKSGGAAIGAPRLNDASAIPATAQFNHRGEVMLKVFSKSGQTASTCLEPCQKNSRTRVLLSLTW